MLKSPCKVFHGTSYAFDCTRMEDRGKGFWFTRNKIDAENYAQHGAERTQGTLRTFDAWVRLEKVLDLGNLYDRATDEVLMDLAHDAHLRLNVLFQLRENCRHGETEEPYLFEITNTPDFLGLVKGRFEGMCGIEVGCDGHEFDVCCVYSKKNIYFQPDDETAVQKVDVGIVDNNESCRARHHE